MFLVCREHCPLINVFQLIYYYIFLFFSIPLFVKMETTIGSYISVDKI